MDDPQTPSPAASPLSLEPITQEVRAATDRIVAAVEERCEALLNECERITVALGTLKQTAEQEADKALSDATRETLTTQLLREISEKLDAIAARLPGTGQ